MLAISSGGDHSAYVLGMLKGVFVTQPQITEWTTVSGISAGALIGTKIAQVDTEDRSNFIKTVNHLMESHQTFTKSWSTMGTIVSLAKAFFWHGGLFKSQLGSMVTEAWGEKYRDLYVGAYNQTEGRYQSFGPRPEIPQVTASASIPIVFETILAAASSVVAGISIQLEVLPENSPYEFISFGILFTLFAIFFGKDRFAVHAFILISLISIIAIFTGYTFFVASGIVSLYYFFKILAKYFEGHQYMPLKNSDVNQMVKLMF